MVRRSVPPYLLEQIGSYVCSMSDTQDDFTSDMGDQTDTGYDADIATTGSMQHSIPEHPHRPAAAQRSRDQRDAPQVILTYPLTHAARLPRC